MKPCIIVLLIALNSIAAWCQDSTKETELDAEAMKQLAGVSGFYVIVGVGDDLQAYLAESTIRTDVELRLRVAHVPVLTFDQYTNKTGGATLSVVVDGYFNSRLNVWAVSCNVECSQLAYLARNRSIPASATCWKSGYIGLSGPSNLSAVRQDITDLADHLINLYLAANP